MSDEKQPPSEEHSKLPTDSGAAGEAPPPEVENELSEKAMGILLHEMRKGTDRMSIIPKLTAVGMSMADASTLVEQNYPGLMQVAREQQFDNSALPFAILGGLLASLVGGGAWGAMIVFLNIEFGILAWGIGVLSGYAVVICSRGKTGLVPQIIAVVSAALGILIGKYVSFYDAVKAVMEEQGQPAYSLMDTILFQLFVENISRVLGPYDLLWVGLAVYSAWMVPKGTGIKVR